MPKSTITRVETNAVTAGTADETTNEQKSGDRKKSGSSATSQILRRLGKIDSCVTQLAHDNDSEILPQVSETLNSQTQAITQVADALRNLEHSLVSAVTEAIDEQLRRGRPQVDEDRQHAEDVAGDSQESPEECPREAGASLSPSSWDDIRSAFLKSHGEGGEETKDLSAAEESTNASAAGQSFGEVDEAESELPEFTSIGDPNSLSEDELRAAVIDQERTISMLASRLQKRSRTGQPLTTEQLEELKSDLPEELQAAVAATLKLLNNQMRYSELELSLERARMSRQASQLEMTSERLNARARAMGLEIAEDGTIGANTSAPRGSKGRNWLGAMGFGN